jgi:hypothetical protein
MHRGGDFFHQMNRNRVKGENIFVIGDGLESANSSTSDDQILFFAA